MQANGSLQEVEQSFANFNLDEMEPKLKIFFFHKQYSILNNDFWVA